MTAWYGMLIAQHVGKPKVLYPVKDVKAEAA